MVILGHKKPKCNKYQQVNKFGDGWFSSRNAVDSMPFPLANSCVTTIRPKQGFGWGLTQQLE